MDSCILFKVLKSGLIKRLFKEAGGRFSASLFVPLLSFVSHVNPSKMHLNPTFIPLTPKSPNESSFFLY